MPETVKISGKQHQIQTRNEVLDLEDVGGHQIGMWENKAINFEGDFAGDGYVTNRGTYDFIMGNGAFKGYGTHLHSNGDVSYNKWEGTMTTKFEGDVPVSTFQGTWEITSGTGEWEKAKANGTFKGNAIALDITFT